jgi:hypothetical protein
MAYSHVPKESRNRLYDRTRRKIILNRDVVFDETKIGYQYLLSDLVSVDGQIPLPISETPFSPEFLAEIDSSEPGDLEMPSLDPELEPHDCNPTPNDTPHSSPTQVSNHNLIPGRTSSLHQRQTIPAHPPTSLPTRCYPTR